MHLSRQSFDQLVEAAIASLPPHLARWLDQVPIIVEDRPAPSDRRDTDSDDGEPLGLYVGPSLARDDGTPLDESPAPLPPRIMLYRLPLMEACSSRDQLAAEIRKTLLHELGHHAGLDEEDLDHHGIGPMDDDTEISWDLDDSS
jgi:predicted Zn-dependent protease with MMP-like domain